VRNYDLKSEKIPTSGSEILTPKECSNPVDALYINIEKMGIRQRSQGTLFCIMV